MAFSDALTNDASVFFNTDEFAIQVTYSTTDINVCIEYGSSGLKDEFNQEFRSDRAVMEVKKSDVSNPDYRDTIIIGATVSNSGTEETWYVMRVLFGDKLSWRLGIERDHRPNFS